MPNYKEIIRMKSLGMSERAISRTVGSSRNTVKIVCAAYLNSGLSTGNFIDESGSQILELLKLGIGEKEVGFYVENVAVYSDGGIGF